MRRRREDLLVRDLETGPRGCIRRPAGPGRGARQRLAPGRRAGGGGVQARPPDQRRRALLRGAGGVGAHPRGAPAPGLSARAVRGGRRRRRFLPAAPRPRLHGAARAHGAAGAARVRGCPGPERRGACGVARHPRVSRRRRDCGSRAARGPRPLAPRGIGCADARLLRLRVGRGHRCRGGPRPAGVARGTARRPALRQALAGAAHGANRGPHLGARRCVPGRDQLQSRDLQGVLRGGGRLRRVLHPLQRRGHRARLPGADAGRAAGAGARCLRLAPGTLGRGPGREGTGPGASEGEARAPRCRPRLSARGARA